MGYSTDFTGQINIDPPLNLAERIYLKRFSQTRHMRRHLGPHWVSTIAYEDSNNERDVIDHNTPCPGVPSLWCDFTPTPDGKAIVWNESEKTQESDCWIRYIIDHFLKPDAHSKNCDERDPQFKEFQYNHVCNGELLAQGEDPHDRWKVLVKDNVVTRIEGRWVWVDD